MKHFSKIPIATGERSKQNLSATTYLTMDFGRLDPLYHTEVCPGDDIELDVSQFMRAAPMPYPVHGNIRHDVRVFFVPYRILQPDDAPFSWNDYITGVSNQSHPYIALSRYAEFLNVMAFSSVDSDGFPLGVYQNDMLRRDARRLFATLGLPNIVYNSTNNTETMLGYSSTLWPLQAYQRIWWDYYRNSELISEQLKSVYLPYLLPGENIIDASSTNGKVHRFLMPRYSCFAKDYFTTSKLNPQSGSSASSVGSSTNILDSISKGVFTQSANKVLSIGGTAASPQAQAHILKSDGTLQSPYFASFSNWPVDSSFTIEIFRRANALQKYLERNNIVGSRLIERFLARFGVAPSAQQLQMSEYLGGSSGTYNVGAVMSSTDTAAQAGSAIAPADGFGMSINQSDTGGSIQGLSTGAGALNINSGKIKYHAKEFGCLMVIGTIVPHVVYTQGLHKKWRRGVVDRFDYLTPEFDRLGYEAVSTSELYFANSPLPQVFGYVPRYSSYKMQNNVKGGDLVLSGTNSSMDCVNVERSFSSMPALTNDFTVITPQERQNLDRIFTFPGQNCEFDHFVGYAHTECHVTRNVSDDGLPALDPDLDDQKKKILVENGGVRF